MRSRAPRRRCRRRRSCQISALPSGPAARPGGAGPCCGDLPDAREHRRGQEPDYYEAVHYEYRFAGLLVCSDAPCGSISSISGRLEHTNRIVEYDTDFGQTEETRHDELVYHPESIAPAPRLFALPKTYPATRHDGTGPGLHALLGRCCGLRELDTLRTGASAHQRRGGSFPKEGQTSSLSLGGRIRAWAGGKPERATLAKAFDAARWIGNEGSHARNVTRDDLFNVLDQLRCRPGGLRFGRAGLLEVCERQGLRDVRGGPGSIGAPEMSWSYG